MTKTGKFSFTTIKQNKEKFLLACALVAVAYCIKFGLPAVVNYLVRTQLEISEGTYLFRKWQTNRHPYKVDFYFFNWTNAEESVRNVSVRPIFQEIGPYRFDLFINRTNITIHRANASMTYTIFKKFVFVKNNDSRFLDDEILTLNPVANGLAYQTRHWSAFSKFGLSLALRATKSELIVRKSIRELLFQGYDDPLLSLAQKLPNFGHMPEKFGYFYKRNHTEMSYGPYNVHIGVDPEYGELQTLKGSTDTPYYPGDCGRVRGKLGEFISPDQDINKELIIYVHDLNVPTSNSYMGDQLIKGIMSSVYGPKDNIFDNGTIDKRNACYCNGECVPGGVLNASANFDNAPIFMSLPHFQLADAYYANQIDLIRTNNRSQMPFIAVERSTGLLVEGALIIQLNQLLQPWKGLGMFADVPKLFVPVFTMRQHIITNGRYLEWLALLQKLPMLINCLSFITLLTALLVLMYAKFVNVTQKIYLPIRLVK